MASDLFRTYRPHTSVRLTRWVMTHVARSSARARHSPATRSRGFTGRSSGIIARAQFSRVHRLATRGLRWESEAKVDIERAAVTPPRHALRPAPPRPLLFSQERSPPRLRNPNSAE